MLTPDKIEEIKQQLVGLAPEEQQKKLKEILQTLSPEEREQLVGKQECPFCLIVQGQIPTKRVYEDAKVMAVLDIRPATKGHTLVFPKEHAMFLHQVPDDTVRQLFSVVAKLSNAVFEAVQAEGTNIVLSQGQLAGQASPHVLVNIIPRFKEDKVAVGWQPGKSDDADLEKIAEEVKKRVPKEKPVEKKPVSNVREELTRRIP